MTNEQAIKVIKRMIKTGIAYDDGYAFEPLAKDEEKACGMAIKALEEPKWIPVSERLPENKTYVLTTIHVPGRQPHSRSGWYEDGLFMNDNGDTWKSSDIEVKAWQPLPKPYSEVDNG